MISAGNIDSDKNKYKITRRTTRVYKKATNRLQSWSSVLKLAIGTVVPEADWNCT